MIEDLGNPVYNGVLCTLNLTAIVVSFVKDHMYEHDRGEVQ